MCSGDQNEDYLSLYDASSDGNKQASSLGKTSPDRTTWNILVLPSALHHMWVHPSSIILCLYCVCLSVCNRMISPEFPPSTQAPTAVAVWTPPPAWPKEMQASLWLRLSLLTTGRQHLHPLHHIHCYSDFSQDPYERGCRYGWAGKIQSLSTLSSCVIHVWAV